MIHPPSQYYFQQLQDRMSKWTIISLNLASKLVLTKKILQTIPVFTLYALPAHEGILQQFRNI